jgi:hypothetical protein
MNIPKLLIVAASLSFSGGLAAQQIVVFAKGEYRVLDAGPQEAPQDPARAAFLDAAHKDAAGQAPYDTAFALINPPAWGRVVNADSTGNLQIRRAFPHGFVFHLDLQHLQPNHSYVLCINGRPVHPGNELLPENVLGHEAEKYYDFYTVTTDGSGSYSAGFALFLRTGAYNVHFYVKDVSDHKIVLYGLDYFDFTAG